MHSFDSKQRDGIQFKNSASRKITPSKTQKNKCKLKFSLKTFFLWGYLLELKC